MRFLESRPRVGCALRHPAGAQVRGGQTGKSEKREHRGQSSPRDEPLCRGCRGGQVLRNRPRRLSKGPEREESSPASWPWPSPAAWRRRVPLLVRREMLGATSRASSFWAEIPDVARQVPPPPEGGQPPLQVARTVTCPPSSGREAAAVGVRGPSPHPLPTLRAWSLLRGRGTAQGQSAWESQGDVASPTHE